MDNNFSQVVLRFIEGNEMKLPLKEETTVANIKDIARDSSRLEGEINLIFKGRILEDNEILKNIPGIESTFVIVHTKKPKRTFEREFLPFLFSDIIPAQYISAIFNLAISRHSNTEPQNFQELVNNLVEMGFEKSDCERALRLSNYDPDSAATMLLSGNLNHFRRFSLIRDNFGLPLNHPGPFQETVSTDNNTEDMSDSNLEYDEEEEDTGDIDDENDDLINEDEMPHDGMLFDFLSDGSDEEEDVNIDGLPMYDDEEDGEEDDE